MSRIDPHKPEESPISRPTQRLYQRERITTTEDADAEMYVAGQEGSAEVSMS
jgi:hypothetical protein